MVIKQKEVAAAVGGMEIPASARTAFDRYGGAFRKENERRSLVLTIQKLQDAQKDNAPRNELDRIIRAASSSFFSSAKRQAAEKVLSSVVYEASLRFKTEGSPPGTHIELRPPQWLYEEGKLTILAGHLRDGLSLRDALNAPDVNIPENLVKVYLFSPRGRRSPALKVHQLAKHGDELVPAEFPGGKGDVRASIGNLKYRD